MPKHYQGESENSTASKKERMKIKKKKHLPFVKAPANLFKDVPQVRRGLKNPLLLLKKREAEEKEKERKRNLKYQKQDKVNRNKS